MEVRRGGNPQKKSVGRETLGKESFFEVHACRKRSECAMQKGKKGQGK